MREVKENTLYRHFKGDIIKVLHIGQDSETLKKVVVYEHNDKVWVRDYDMFLSKVDKNKYPDIDVVYRFTEVK